MEDYNVERAISFEEGLSLAQTFEGTYFEISTKRGTNCEDLFEQMAQ